VKQGLQHFDSWAAPFGEPVTAMELSPDGAEYRLNTRFARFVNVPELMQQFRQMADIQTSEMLLLPVPKLKITGDTGTNVQERLIALHHIDAPWWPADIEQREGRILRQGNQNPEVKIFRYVTEGSFGAYMWGVLETKC